MDKFTTFSSLETSSLSSSI